jgi:hypothetical protein
MKSLKICSFALFVTIVLSACSSNHVTITWDAPTTLVTGSEVPANHDIRYHVYLDCVADDHHNHIQQLTQKPIPETTYQIPHAKEDGHYIVGVQAVLFEPGNQDPAVSSEIAWSDINQDTNGKPFDLDVRR